MTHHTFCKFHLGDNLIVLNFLRRLAARYPEHRFIHAAKSGWLPQLREVVKDLPAISLLPLEQSPAGAIHAWSGAGRPLWCLPFGGFRDQHPDKFNWSRFHIDWLRHLAGQMGLESPIAKPEDLLFDYPAIRETVMPDWKCDVLVINARPGSGQLKAYGNARSLKHRFRQRFGKGGVEVHQEDDFMSPAIEQLIAAGHNVVTTQPHRPKAGDNRPIPPCTADHGLTVTNIGNLSLRCKYIVMVATGPMWPTLNVWNVDTVKLRITLLDREQLNLPGNIVQVNTIEATIAALKTEGLI